MESSSPAPALCHRLDFDRFSLLPDRRQLLKDGVPIRLGARAFDILVTLAERPGELVTKDELIAQVWSGVFVDPTNLRVGMAAVRKALEDGDGRLIRTDPGQGYRLTAQVARTADARSPVRVVTAAPSQLPTRVMRIIGRSEFIADVAAQLPRRRLITIAGPGGIGKTTVAVACAEVLAGSYRDGVGFVDLTEAAEAASVVPALAAALGITISTDDARRDVVGHFRGRQMLLVIDNCEHVIQAAAELIEAISVGAPGVHILATSRESLRVTGEWVRRLPALTCPPDATKLSASEALSYPAVELFVERATATRLGYQLGDAEASVVGEICRSLDGVALAIELAAAQVEVFGVAWLAAHLDRRLWILKCGRRTAVPRHQTLTAMLDWSYELLSEQERATLQRIAVFPGEFTLADAIGSATDDGIRDFEMVGGVYGLVSKSLAMLDDSGSVTRYRLPETTRVYAHARLQMTEPEFHRSTIQVPLSH
ncbi:MAG TPA: winged helix-turn-helix domain-containing protein [Acetobacteraceae bacterium]|jgi:predicted ATPase/DNA-binding winged helix-turn-helix (wHTH) protein